MVSLKKMAGVFAVLAFALGVTIVVMAATTATQNVQITVEQIDSVSVDGDPGVLQITAFGPAGEDTDSSTNLTYGTNNIINRKVTAKVDSDLPAGVTLTVEIADSGIAPVSLNTSNQDVVTNISSATSATKQITYAAQAAPGTADQSVSRTVTFTIVAQ
jgi:hypothetical protein